MGDKENTPEKKKPDLTIKVRHPNDLEKEYIKYYRKRNIFYVILIFFLLLLYFITWSGFSPNKSDWGKTEPIWSNIPYYYHKVFGPEKKK